MSATSDRGQERTILALESSCDDTCAAILAPDGRLLANVISSQGLHDRFGGVVPEVAARHHLERFDAVIAEALHRAELELDDIELLAATQGPGLVGALLVGFATGKAMAAARGLPFVPVDHLQGHVAANFIAPVGEPPTTFEPPFVCLIASGGHTLLARVEQHDGFTVIGRTLDDAAGEAFDKGARMLGLGYPGGAALERLAAEGDPGSFDFPAGARSRGGRGVGRQVFANSLDFSFAGLKTALLYRVRDLNPEQLVDRAADLAASYQDAIVRNLVERAEQALEQTGLGRLAVGGGVAANGALRGALEGLGAELHVPARILCTDNAAMIASAARFVRPMAPPSYFDLDVYATGERPL